MEWYKIANTAYSINKDGFLRNDNTGNISTGSKTSQGYYELRYRKVGVPTYRRLVHVILAEMFLEKPEGDYVVDHKDDIKTNNKLDNLQYITRGDNGAKGQYVRDESTTWKAVNQYSLDGTFIKRHDSITQACIAIGVAKGPLIGYACRGRCSTNNCNTAYGYLWSFVDDDIVQPPQ